MKLRRRLPLLVSVVLSLIGLAVWQFSPFPALVAIANLSDPAKLATLGERGANPRLNKIVFWLHEAERKGLPPATTLRFAQFTHSRTSAQAALVQESLLRNLKIANELGLLSPENLDRLKRGRAGVVTRGPYSADSVEIDHIVPISLAPEVGNDLANLEMLPEKLNRRKSNRVESRQLAHARKLLDAGLLTADSFARVQAKAQGAPSIGKRPPRM